MSRPKIPRNYCSTASEVIKQQEEREAKRRAKIRKGMFLYREDERTLSDACMSTQEMRDLEAVEQLVWALFLNKDK